MEGAGDEQFAKIVKFGDHEGFGDRYVLTIDLKFGQPNQAVTYESGVQFSITLARDGKVLYHSIAVKYKIKTGESNSNSEQQGGDFDFSKQESQESKDDDSSETDVEIQEENGEEIRELPKDSKLRISTKKPLVVPPLSKE